MESKERTASVLGALMGFDEQQSQQHAPRHSRVLSEGYLRRVASIGLGVLKQKSPRKHHRFGMTIEDPKESINILEAEDSFKSDRHCNELRDREKTDFALSAAYMPSTRHYFVNEKHFLTDKVIQTSREFQDLPEVTDSMDISPRFTREQNLIFNHIEKGPSVVSHTQLQHKTFLKSSYTSIVLKNNAGTESKDGERGQAYSSKDLALLKSSSPFLEQKYKPCLPSYSPTYLKGSCVVSKDCKEFPSSQNGEHIGEETERKNVAYVVEPIRSPPQVSRILDGNRGKTKHDLVNSIMKVSRSASLCDDKCRKETDFTMSSSPSISNWKAESQHSCFFPVGSYRARESRQKIIEEQKMNEKSEQILSTQDRKMSKMPLTHHVKLPSDLNGKPIKCGLKNHVCSKKKHLHSGSPLCLSRKVGRLEQLSKKSQRFKSLSASTETARSGSRSRYESLRNTWFVKSEGPAIWLHCKPLDQNSNKKDASEPALRLSSKELRVFPCPDSASDHIVNDACMVVDHLNNRVEKKSLFDQHYFSPLSSRRSVLRRTQNNPIRKEIRAIKCSLKNEHQDDNISITASNVVAVKTDVMEVPSVDFKKQEHDLVSCILLETYDVSSTNSSPTTCSSIQQEASIRFDKEGPAFEHCPRKELNSTVSLEEAYQPSPVSVLEPLFKEETLSSSESLKKLCINCRDLIMQLELLMSESWGTNSEGPEMIVSSDDDRGEGSILSSQESEDIMSTSKFKDSRDFSYLVDVLTEAGLHCKKLNKGCVSPHGLERHLISPSVFETLEKKFGELISWRRSERKLLFDRINSGLIKLFQSFVGVPEWAKPVSRRFRPLLNREMIEEELWILLDSQEREVTKDLVDKQFGKEIGWIDLGNEIDSICRELERLLIEELVAEFGSMGCF